MFCVFCSSLRNSKKTVVRFLPKGSAASSSQAVETAHTTKIVIPNRIERNPLSILQALSATAERDFNATNYKYVDDPYLAPQSNRDKKTYALSKGSGKLAAQWVLKEHADSFSVFNIDEPGIEALCPPKTTYVINDVSEMALLERIGMRRTLDAFKMYKELTGQGEILSMETVNQLLDLLCILNSEDPGTKILVSDEVFFDNGLHADWKIVKTWKDGGAAEFVFNNLPEKNAAAYNSIIKGMCKYFQVEMAFKLFREALSLGHQVDLDTYNAVVGISTSLSDEYLSKWNRLQEVLMIMHDHEVQPDLQTFNKVFSSLSRIRKWYHSKTKVMQIINEMNMLGIEPSMTTWFYILNIFYPTEESENDMLNQIIECMKGKHYRASAVSDFVFFKLAMQICCNNLKDVELAYAIDDVLNFGSNAQLLGNRLLVSLYYSHLFKLIFSIEPIEKIMEFYEKYVPNVWTPTDDTMLGLIESLELHDAFSYIPTIWSDLKLYGRDYQVQAQESLLQLMAKKTHDEQLQSQFSEIVWALKEMFDEEHEQFLRGRRTRAKPLILTGEMIGNMIMVCCKSDQLDRAWQLFALHKKHTQGFGTARHPSEQSLLELCESCIDVKDKEKVTQCVIMMSNLGYNKYTKMLCEKAKEQLELTEFQVRQLEAI